jgi:hypothetical protein
MRHKLGRHCERIYLKYVEEYAGNCKSSFLHHTHADCSTRVSAGSTSETLFSDTFGQDLLTGQISTLSKLAVRQHGTTLFPRSGFHEIL